MSKKKTNEQFIIDSKKVHGDKYDYSKTNYVNNHTKVIIICPIHGEFLQVPWTHINGCNCGRCSGKIKSNNEEFINKSKKIHGNKYDYSKTSYIKNNIKVEIICKKHGAFWQVPANHTNLKHGCPKCGGRMKLNIHNFISKSKKVHGNIYNYTRFKYINNNTKSQIVCLIHGTFLQDAKHHLLGNGCPKCCNNTISNIHEFINKARKIHNNEYGYLKTNYVNAKQKIEITCKKHGSFFQTPNNHLRNNKCPKCKKQVSKPEMEFLNYMNIPNTKENRQKYVKPYKVDGFDTNTIYEFLGDYYHGNPKKYSALDYNKICHKTFGELYDKTFEKFQTLKGWGYEIKYIWESDWNNWNKLKIGNIPIIKY